MIAGSTKTRVRLSGKSMESVRLGLSPDRPSLLPFTYFYYHLRLEAVPASLSRADQ